MVSLKRNVFRSIETKKLPCTVTKNSKDILKYMKHPAVGNFTRDQTAASGFYPERANILGRTIYHYAK